MVAYHSIFECEQFIWPIPLLLDIKSISKF